MPALSFAPLSGANVESNAASGKGSRPQRLALVDALRGIAAFGVVLYHVPSLLREAAGIGGWLDLPFRHGDLGVNVFFVLSGFVMAMSTSTGPWSGGYLARFVLRRSIRLDPPYWLAIAVEVALGFIGVTWLAAKAYPFPSAVDLAAHVTYTQDIFGRAQISDVFWTLCFEVQFYLVLVSALVICTSATARRYVSPRVSLRVLFVGILVISVLVRNQWISNPLPGTGLIRAYEFQMGVACFLLVSSRISPLEALIVALTVIVGRVAVGGYMDIASVGVAFSLCALSWKFPTLNAMASVAPLQFMGKVSYSWYLFHASIIGRGSSFILMTFDESPSRLLMCALLVGIVAASLLFSTICFYVVERPALILSRRVAVR